VLCFWEDKKAVLVFCGEGPGLAGIRERFPNGERERHDGLPFSTKAPFRLVSLATMYNVAPTGGYR